MNRDPTANRSAAPCLACVTLRNNDEPISYPGIRRQGYGHIQGYAERSWGYDPDRARATGNVDEATMDRIYKDSHYPLYLVLFFVSYLRSNQHSQVV
ncbi:hypothetical protein BDV06DRAFT_207433, partial [Aspergillus oleicola]